MEEAVEDVEEAVAVERERSELCLITCFVFVIKHVGVNDTNHVGVDDTIHGRFD